MYEKSNMALPDLVSMKKLLFCLLLVSCGQSTYKPQIWWEEEDTIVDRSIIDKIDNAETIEDIFPSDTLDEGPSYEEYFNE